MEEYSFHNLLPNWNRGDNFCIANEYSVEQIVDLKTGVNYMMAYSYASNHEQYMSVYGSGGYGWGYGYGYGGMTVRFKTDGTPYISSLDEIKQICVNFIRNNHSLKDGNYNFYLQDGLYQIVLKNNKYYVTVDAGNHLGTPSD